MGWENFNFITLRDLGVAFRKTKADLYYESGHPNAFAVCEYEQNLRLNLEALYNKLGRKQLEVDDKTRVRWRVVSHPKGHKRRLAGQRAGTSMV